MNDERTDRGFEYQDISRASSTVRLLRLFDAGEEYERTGQLMRDSELMEIVQRIRPDLWGGPFNFAAMEVRFLLSEVRRELVMRYRRAAKGNIPDPEIDALAQALGNFRRD